MKARKWILKSHFSGLPKREDLEIVEEDLPPLKDGGRKGSRGRKMGVVLQASS